MHLAPLMHARAEQSMNSDDEQLLGIPARHEMLVPVKELLEGYLELVVYSIDLRLTGVGNLCHCRMASYPSAKSQHSRETTRSVSNSTISQPLPKSALSLNMTAPIALPAGSHFLYAGIQPFLCEGKSIPVTGCPTREMMSCL